MSKFKDNGWITVGTQVIRPGPVKPLPLTDEQSREARRLLGICEDCNNIKGHDGECK